MNTNNFDARILAIPHLKHEVEISSRLVGAALKLGCYVSVNDGEEITVIQSRDRSAITAAMFTSDEDYLIIHDKDGKRLGFIRLIHGNDMDLISDYTVNDTLKEIVSAADTYLNAQPVG